MDYGLIGKKLSHSFSAEIHPKLFNCDYSLYELDEGELENFFSKRRFMGINVTVPYKKAVMKYLDYIDDDAEKIGAVNTVLNKNGRLYGYNTDFSGLKALIVSSGVSLKDKSVIILGSGGTAKTAKAVSENLGAGNITLISRTGKNGADTYENLKKYHKTADILINTTPVGMYPDVNESPVSIREFERLTAVFDVIYNPLRTKLVCDALKKGIIAEGGLKMLVFQAVFAARLFSGKDIPEKKSCEIFEQIKRQKENIVLIGMPSSGKSTVGKLIAKRLGREFVDTDDLIYSTHKMSPKNIIENSGEAVFRSLETAIINDLSLKQGLVIATGGGAVEREENIDLLKKNGKLFFLNRKFEGLCADTSRPLSSNKEQLKALYKRRLPLYKKYADYTVYDFSSPENTANSVLEMIF